jgi:hypothetical protein
VLVKVSKTPAPGARSANDIATGKPQRNFTKAEKPAPQGRGPNHLQGKGDNAVGVKGKCC